MFDSASPWTTRGRYREEIPQGFFASRDPWHPPLRSKAFKLDVANFNTIPSRTPWWVKRSVVTTLFGLAHLPCSTCFCTSMGTGPFVRLGLDAMMTDTGDGYAIQVLTEKAKHLLGITTGWESASGAVKATVEGLKSAAMKSIGTAFDPAPIGQRNMTELFNSPIWDEIQFACINCGTCTFLCPTCWCFDIQDEVQGDKGDRLRLWDSCMFPLFTFHGSGHNPRIRNAAGAAIVSCTSSILPGQVRRGAACVGCGRCVQPAPSYRHPQVGRQKGRPLFVSGLEQFVNRGGTPLPRRN